MLVGAVGTLDGLKLPVEVSPDSQVQNAMYNGWLHSNFVLNVLTFLPTGELFFIARCRTVTHPSPR